MDKITIEKLKNNKYTKIGELDLTVISMFNLNRKPCNIMFWSNRIPKILNHKQDFSNDDSFNLAIENINNIILKPDYVGYRESDKSIQYIKKLDNLIIVCIAFKQDGNLNFRTMYPLRQSQLNKYISQGSVNKYIPT